MLQSGSSIMIVYQAIPEMMGLLIVCPDLNNNFKNNFYNLKKVCTSCKLYLLVLVQKGFLNFALFELDFFRELNIPFPFKIRKKFKHHLEITIS